MPVSIATPTYTVRRPFTFDGVQYRLGDTIDPDDLGVDAQKLARLVRGGLLWQGRAPAGKTKGVRSDRPRPEPESDPEPEAQATPAKRAARK